MSSNVDQQQHQLSCCISHHFNSTAAENLHNIAVIHASSSVSDDGKISSSPLIYDGDRCFTYADLLSAVNSFSCRIRRVLDGADDPDLVKPKELGQGNLVTQQAQVDTNGNPRIVAVFIAPSVEYIAAVLSILRCGEAFLPLDPLWPKERILSIIASSKVSLVIGCLRIYSTSGMLRSDAVDWIADQSSCSVLLLSAVYFGNTISMDMWRTLCNMLI